MVQADGGDGVIPFEVVYEQDLVFPESDPVAGDVDGGRARRADHIGVIDSVLAGRHDAVAFHGQHHHALGVAVLQQYRSAGVALCRRPWRTLHWPWCAGQKTLIAGGVGNDRLALLVVVAGRPRARRRVLGGDHHPAPVSHPVGPLSKPGLMIGAAPA
ncbi:hypothetical protein SNK04_014179 [Fusarium graminearum]